MTTNKEIHSALSVGCSKCFSHAGQNCFDLRSNNFPIVKMLDEFERMVRAAESQNVTIKDYIKQCKVSEEIVDEIIKEEPLSEDSLKKLQKGLDSAKNGESHYLDSFKPHIDE